MKWHKDAEAALVKVPFFIRKRVRKRVEEEAASCGEPEVCLHHVKACQQKFLRNMESEVRGFEIEQCFGSHGCPNRASPGHEVANRLEPILVRKDLRGFLKNKVKEPLKIHHQFRISISDCPNACSRPQITDIGLIGARRPVLGGEPCQRCGACEEVCKERAIFAAVEEGFPVLDGERCVGCGQCIDVCPSGTVKQLQTGFRILIGGKLGRHPRLGTELKGIFGDEEAVAIVERCLEHYMRHSSCGERLAEILNREPLDFSDCS